MSKNEKPAAHDMLGALCSKNPCDRPEYYALLDERHGRS